MSSRVSRVELYHYASRLPATFRPSWIPGFPQNENRATLVRILTEDGVEGWSAGPASSGEVRDPAARISEAGARFDEGFRTFKLRVHEDEDSDLRQVRETVAAVGDRMTIGVDVNQAWRVTAISDAPLWDLERAKRFADACAGIGVGWIEEPLAMDAYDDLVALTSHSEVPIAGGELHTGAYPELAMMVERRCYDIFQPDAVFTGGIDQTFRLIQKVREAGLSYTPHTWTNGVGFAINLQLKLAAGPAAAKPLEYPLDPPGWVPEARDSMLERPFVHDKGWLDPPRGPGLGIEIDRGALRKHGKRFFSMDRKRLILFALRDRGIRASKEIDEAKKARGMERG